MSHRIPLALAAIMAMLVTLSVRANGAKEPPGTVLSEESDDLGNGYRAIRRSVVNPATHWEGIGHFEYVYQGKEELCQCGRNDVAIAPDGKFSLYVNRDGKLMLYRASDKTRKQLSNTFIGYPKKAEWRPHAKRVVVSLEKYDQGVGKISERSFPLGR